MENIISNLVKLAVNKRNLWQAFSKRDSDLTDAYWSEYHAVVESLAIVTGKTYSEAIDMVFDAI